MKRQYAKLSFGPNFVAWFDHPDQVNAATPRLYDVLRRLGVVRFVKVRDEAWPHRAREVLAEEPAHKMLVEVIHLEPAEFDLLAANNPEWASEPK